MPSPFPGMNPFLEQSDAWQDFHDRMVPALSDAIAPQVNPQFMVKIEEHLYIHELSAEQRSRIGNADVSVSREPHTAEGQSKTQAVSTAPARIVLPAVVFERQPYLEIRDRMSRELVTVIELLSPCNKQPGPDREQYLAKRRNLLRGNVHVVEIDLLRGGPRLPLGQAPACDYYVMVSRTETRPEAEFWPLALRQSLPAVPIPLRSPYADACVNLQDILHAVYDRAYYKNYIYYGSPQPPLVAEDEAWAATFLAGASGTS